MTDNHTYVTPAEGSLDWHVPLNTNFEQIDTDLEIRDTDGNRDQYSPVAGAKYFAVDTGTRYLGDGSSWIEAPTPETRVRPNTRDTDPDTAGVGQVWYRTDLNELRLQTSSGPVSLPPEREPSTDTDAVWRLDFEDVAPEATKSYSDRDTETLRQELLNRGWDDVNNHVDHGLDFLDDAVTGSHSLAFYFAEGERMGFDARKHIGGTEAYAQYWLKFSEGFDVTDDDFASWADGGKLPGWHLTESLTATEPGKAWLTFHDPERAGFTPHNESGDIHLNYYVENHDETDAGTEPWNEHGVVSRGEWVELTLYCDTETGRLRAWVDGALAFDDASHDFAGRDIAWAHIGYFGGGWYSPQDQHALTDDLRIYRSSPL